MNMDRTPTTGPLLDCPLFSAPDMISFFGSDGEKVLSLRISENGVEVKGDLTKGAEEFFQYLKSHLIDPYFQQKLSEMKAMDHQ